MSLRGAAGTELRQLSLTSAQRFVAGTCGRGLIERPTGKGDLAQIRRSLIDRAIKVVERIVDETAHRSS